MPSSETPEIILDAAEAMLAEHGYAGTSLRRLTAAAGVNLAAVNYHFGGKEGLTEAVLTRRIAPINAERLRRLDQLEEGDPTIADIVRAFVEPALRAVSAPGKADDPGDLPGTRMCRMFGRILVEQPPFLRPFLGSQFGPIIQRFAAMCGGVLDGQGTATTWWRLHFTVGAMAHTLQNAATVAEMSGGLCDAHDVDTLVEELVAFAAAGFAAKTPEAAGK